MARARIATIVLPLVCLCIAACSSGPGSLSGLGGIRWTKNQPTAVLKDGSVLRGWYYENVSPQMPTWHVYRGGRKVVTLEDLRRSLVAIDTQEKALAYRKLLRDVTLDGQPDASPAAAGVSLTFHEIHRQYMSEFTPEDQARWGIGRERVIEQQGEAFVITEPQYRLPVVRREDGRGWTTTTSQVELVRETIHRNGRYTREILRVLEEGKAADRHQPAPIF